MLEGFDPDMFPDRLTIEPDHESEDADGGIVDEPGRPDPAPLPCRIRYGEAREVVVEGASTSLTPARISLPADPGVELDDWLVDARGRRIRALGRATPRDAARRLWVLAGQMID